MVCGNPLIHIVEMKQMWWMYAAAVDMHEDTICDLAEELQGSTSRRTSPGRRDDAYGWIRIPDTRYQIPDTRYQIPDTGSAKSASPAAALGILAGSLASGRI